MTSAAVLEAFVLGLGLALGGGSLLFLSRQCRALTNSLGRDFKAILFVGTSLGAEEIKGIEAKLRALKGVEETRYVTSDEALARLTREDPDFVRSVALVGPNPLPSAFEIKLGADGFALNPAVLAQLAAVVGDKATLRYSRKELEALFEAKFYARVIGLVMATLSCLALVLILPAAISFVHSASLEHAPLSVDGESILMIHPASAAPWRAWLRATAGGIWPLFTSSSFGALIGLGLAWLVFWPGAVFLPQDPFPSAGSQAALVVTCGALGWALLGRGEGGRRQPIATESNGHERREKSAGSEP